MRVGILGGTFDPVHLGHLIIAEEARSCLVLHRMAFVPAGQPPHKLDRTITGTEQRLHMLREAIAGNPCFELSRVDIDRPGPCYSVDTVRLLQELWGADTEIHFLVGSDSLAEMPTWHHPERLIQLCRIVAVRRPGYEIDLGALDRAIPGAAARIEMLDAPVLDISSTEIKLRVREGRSIRYLVPAPVERYIYEHGLYRRR
jgi:nicotinate-nucleotide adenylyltransferase